jgi:hypothetical protein
LRLGAGGIDQKFAVAEIRKRSAILKAIEEKSEITILPVGYAIEDGKISPLAVIQ